MENPSECLFTVKHFPMIVFWKLTKDLKAIRPFIISNRSILVRGDSEANPRNNDCEMGKIHPRKDSSPSQGTIDTHINTLSHNYRQFSVANPQWEEIVKPRGNPHKHNMLNSTQTVTHAQD